MDILSVIFVMHGRMRSCRLTDKENKQGPNSLISSSHGWFEGIQLLKLSTRILNILYTLTSPKWSLNWTRFSFVKQRRQIMTWGTSKYDGSPPGLAQLPWQQTPSTSRLGFWSGPQMFWKQQFSLSAFFSFLRNVQLRTLSNVPNKLNTLSFSIWCGLFLFFFFFFKLRTCGTERMSFRDETSTGIDHKLASIRVVPSVNQLSSFTCKQPWNKFKKRKS